MPVEQILPGLWRVGGGTWNRTVQALSAEDDANVYLLRGPQGAALVDCGSPEGRTAIESNVRETGHEPAQLRDLLLTHSHWDHTQAAYAWQTEHGLCTHLNAVGADFVARGDLRLVGTYLHGPDYPFTPFAVDHPVADSESFELVGIPVSAHYLPGHTPDSTIFLFDHEGVRVGISGDVAFGHKNGDIPALGFLCALWLSDLEAYVESLRRMAELPVDLLLPGHGAVVSGREEVRAAVLLALGTAERLLADPAVRGDFGVVPSEP
jgi:metallo-beta-lactamase class B